MPLSIESEPPNPRGIVAQLRDPLIRLSFASTQASWWRQCCFRFPPKTHLSFEAQTQKPSTGGFDAQTAKPLDTCHYCPRPPICQVFYRLRLTCPSAILTWSPQVSATYGRSSGFSGPLVKAPASVLHRSQSISTDPLDLHLRRQPSSPSSTPAHHNPRDMLHNPTHTSVSSNNSTQSAYWQSLITNRTTWVHISTMC
jgi:hypothetical protein